MFDEVEELRTTPGYFVTELTLAHALLPQIQAKLATLAGSKPPSRVKDRTAPSKKAATLDACQELSRHSGIMPAKARRKDGNAQTMGGVQRQSDAGTEKRAVPPLVSAHLPHLCRPQPGPQAGRSRSDCRSNRPSGWARRAMQCSARLDWPEGRGTVTVE
jgi:hypothetical protein